MSGGRKFAKVFLKTTKQADNNSPLSYTTPSQSQQPQRQGKTIVSRRPYQQQNNNSGLSNNIKLSSPPNQGMGLTSDFLAQWIPSDDDFDTSPSSPPPPKERPNQGMTITQVSGDQLGLYNASVISPINSQKRSTSLSTPFQQLQQQGGLEHSIGIRMPYKQQNNNSGLSNNIKLSQSQQQPPPPPPSKSPTNNIMPQPQGRTIGLKRLYNQQNNNPNNDSSSLSDFDTPPPSSKKRNMGPIPKKRQNQEMTITQVSGDPLDSYNASVQSLLSNISVSSYTSSPRGTSIYKDVDLSKNKDVIKSPRRLLEELSPGIYNNIEGHTANVRYQVHSGNYLRDRIFTFPFSSGTREKNYPETIQWPKNELDKYNNYLLPQKDLGKNDSEMKGIRKVKEHLPDDFRALYEKSNDPNMSVKIEMQTYYPPCKLSVLQGDVSKENPEEINKEINAEYKLPYYYTINKEGKNLKKYDSYNKEIQIKKTDPINTHPNSIFNRGVGCEYELLKTPEKINNMASAVTNNNQNLNLKVKSNILVKNANDGGINYY